MSTPKLQESARSSITAVLHRYASLAREGVDWSEMAKLFAPDGLYRLPNGAVVDPSRMSEVVQGKEAKYIRHHITTIDMTFVSDDEVHSEAFYLAVTDQASPDHWGMWKDIFRRYDDDDDASCRWLIQDRTIVVEGAAPNGWCASVYGGKT